MGSDYSHLERDGGVPAFPEELPARQPGATLHESMPDLPGGVPHPSFIPRDSDVRPPRTPYTPRKYETLDSGVRQPYDSGMVRDTQDGKARFDLLRPQGVPYEAQFMTRVAMLMTRGAGKYGFRNWEKANSEEEIERFENSAERHMQQWLAGETDEDHAAAVVFNLLAAETTRWKIEQEM